MRVVVVVVVVVVAARRAAVFRLAACKTLASEIARGTPAADKSATRVTKSPHRNR